MIDYDKQKHQLTGSSRALYLVFLAVLGFSVCHSAMGDEKDVLQRQFKNPPKRYRIIQYGEPQPEQIEKYELYGIGGFHCFFYDELRDPSHPQYKDPAKVPSMIAQANKKGFQIWLADDFGYPSGMAGGRVVKEDPNYEVRGLVHLKHKGRGRVPVVFDIPADTERIVVAVMYPLKGANPDYSRSRVLTIKDSRRVQTKGFDGDWQLSVFALKIRDHDSQAQSTMKQFKHSGRYPDLMNPDAVRCFIKQMHEPIAEMIGNKKEMRVRGFYTNEANLMMLHWNGQKPAPYAYLPWNSSLPGRFLQMHGYDLIPLLGMLYAGDDLEARRVRMHFHQVVADLLTDSFARQIRQWCNDHGVLSSGHFLLNEYLSMHVACYGDLMKFVSEFDIPALDIGIPNPDRFESFPYQQTKYFSSVASWKERDEVICLADPIIAGGGLKRMSPAVPLMRNTANMAFLHGANQITSYTPLDPVNTKIQKASGYTPEDYRELNEYVGRISLLLRGAHRETAVGLYYPIAIFQADYKPSNLHWSKVVKVHQPRQQAWDKTQQALLDAGIDYDIIHPEALKEAIVKNGNMKIGYGSYRYLVMPQVEIISEAELKKIRQFQSSGGIVLWVDNKPVIGAYPREDEGVKKSLSGVEVCSNTEFTGQIQSPYGEEFVLNFEEGRKLVSIARFRRGKMCIYYLVSRHKDPVRIGVSSVKSMKTELWDPFTGNISLLDRFVEIPPQGSILLIHPAK